MLLFLFITLDLFLLSLHQLEDFRLLLAHLLRLILPVHLRDPLDHGHIILEAPVLTGPLLLVSNQPVRKQRVVELPAEARPSCEKQTLLAVVQDQARQVLCDLCLA